MIETLVDKDSVLEIRKSFGIGVITCFARIEGRPVGIVAKGDRVNIYLPMIPEAAVAMLACARIGAAHSVVFGGFSPDSLVDRINDAGAVVVVVIGYLVGMSHAVDVVAATNSQVAGRVSPKLIDLTAALATGVVGAFALVRSDVSDTLPGVAIAISLVPPLAVVGLTLESGQPTEAAGALLLFATNVAAIIATGTFVLLAFRVRHAVSASGRPIAAVSKGTIAVVVAAVIQLV